MHPVSDGPPTDQPPPPEPTNEDPQGGFRIERTGAPSDDAGGTPGSRRVALGIVAGLLVLTAAIGAFVATRPDPPPPATTTSSTTEPSTSTTQTTISELVVVARARQPTIEVSSAPPASWLTEATSVRFGSPAPPSSAEELEAAGAAKQPLPNPDYPIQGRRSTPTGWIFSNPTSFDNPFVMMVTERRGDTLEVQIPVRPNGGVGYVQADQVDLSTIDQRLELDLSDRQLRFFQDGVLVAETSVVIGKDGTRTPTGRFYVTDEVPKSNPDGAYGPLVLATSAYSEDLDEFDGGAPVIAFHGTNQPELIGTEASNGCIRMPNEVVTLIGDRLQLGARVDISP